MTAHPVEPPSDRPDQGRREFVAASLATGLAGIGGTAAAAALPVTEADVTIPTPDGHSDAAYFHPAAGRHAGVIVWTDAFGLRPSMRGIGRRLAAQGYAVLVPNPFYRVAKSPVVESAANFDFSDPKAFGRLRPLMASVGAAGAAERDAQAYAAFLDAQTQVDPTRRLGVQGYCMGGPLVVRTAAALPARIGAGASFHGGGLVTDKPDSPHRLAPRIKARMYFGIAASDDERQPEAKDELEEAFQAARNPATIVVYPAHHGWCVPDMPREGGKPIYDAVQAERAWAALLALYRGALTPA
ncbi:MAG: dienelactone hydrolase family protein [Burkholderiales bacterium]|nr:dienelactone hydrolase family protein [Burkholderiales bacterium]MDE1929542.1 dienelactone hydrolase family protein [Burkholderiales bacterium]MDE2157489.1 dienelactone hydrolase family protein [Burkholderiales bacterium]